MRKKQPQAYRTWVKVVTQKMPHLSKPQAVVLAMWSFGIALTHSCGLTTVFKDCKTGGYNLEKCQGSDERLLALVLLIAIAYTSAIKQGAKIKSLGVQKYVCRLKESSRTTRRHSTFWVGLYGRLWVDADENCQELVEELMRLTPNKLPFYQQGQRAKRLILSSF